MNTSEKNTDQEPIVLALAADETFALPSGVALHSSLSNLNNGCTIFVYVLDGGIREESRKRLRRVAGSFEHIDVHLEICTLDTSAFDDLEAKLPGHYSPAMFLDLKAPKVVDKNFGKAILIDPDVVVEDSLTELWKEDVSGHALSALKVHVVSNPRFGIARWRELGLSPNAPFFNSGVYVTNLDYWRRENVEGKVLSYLRAHSDEGINRLGDQEGLNAVLAGKWKEIDPTWNVNLHIAMDEGRFEHAKREEGTPGNRKELLHDPSIIHYTARTKPWVPGSTCPSSFRQRFNSYLRESNWFTPREYIWWRSKVLLRRFWWRARRKTRPLRKKIKLVRS